MKRDTVVCQGSYFEWGRFLTGRFPVGKVNEKVEPW